MSEIDIGPATDQQKDNGIRIFLACCIQWAWSVGRRFLWINCVKIVHFSAEDLSLYLRFIYVFVHVEDELNSL